MLLQRNLPVGTKLLLFKAERMATSFDAQANATSAQCRSWPKTKLPSPSTRCDRCSRLAAAAVQACSRLLRGTLASRKSIWSARMRRPRRIMSSCRLGNR